MSSFTPKLMDSLVNFSLAAKWERRCLFAIAARTRPADLEIYRPAFQEIARGSRWLVVADISEAFHRANRRIDVERFLRAASMTGQGGLTFIEFVAACLYDRLGPLDANLYAHHSYSIPPLLSAG